MGSQQTQDLQQITFGGQTLSAFPVTADHYSEIVEALKAKLPNPFIVARDNMAIFKDDPAAQRMLLDIAMRHTLSGRPYLGPQEVTTWLGTLDGAKFGMWLRLRDNDPTKYTLDYVSGIMDATLTDLLAKSDRKPPVTGPAESCAQAPIKGAE